MTLGFRVYTFNMCTPILDSSVITLGIAIKRTSSLKPRSNTLCCRAFLATQPQTVTHSDYVTLPSMAIIYLAAYVTQHLLVITH